MTVGSLFSGVGGFDMGLEAAGMEVVWQVECDEQAASVLRHHWPDVDLHKDVCDVGAANLARVDLICGGFPCQDLSVAGRRAGLAGERSGLFHEFMRIVDELAPRWVLIENVPGLLSSNDGRDMGVVLRTLGDLGYGWAYRVLDTQYFGPPQRRRRVFIVGRAGGFCPPEVLLEPESLPWNPPPSREAREGAAGGAEGGVGGAGRVAWTLTKREAKGPGSSVDSGNIVAETLREHPRPGSNSIGATVAHTLRGEGFDASEDGTGRGTPIVAPTLRVGGRDQGAGDGPDNTPIIAYRASEYRTGQWTEDERAAALTRGTDPSRNGLVLPLAFDWQKGNDVDNPRPSTMNATPESPTLGSTRVPAVSTAIPRRLTPRECERLQGWPDDWTKCGTTEDGETVELADSPRYRMVGNGVSAPVADWIGRRIVAADAVQRADEDDKMYRRWQGQAP